MKNQRFDSNMKIRARWAASLLILALLLAGLSGCGLLGNTGPVLTRELVEPLDGATSAKFDIYTGNGNLTIDTLTGGEPLLAGGTMQYLESLGEPARTLVSFNGQSSLTLKWNENGGACLGAIEWLLHLNPTVSSDIIARSGGGNITLNLAAMALTRLAAETGGGNVEVILPEDAANLSVSAKSGAGNVVVTVPSGSAARIQATTGLGKVIVDNRFTKIDDKTYQSPDYDTAASKVELTLGTGAGNVEVKSQ